MMKAAATCADRIVLNLVPVEFAQRAAATGTPVAVWLVAAVDPSPQGLGQVRRQLAMYLAVPGYSQVLAEAGMDEAVRAATRGVRARELVELLGDDQLERITALGSIGEVRHRIAAYRAAGAAVMVVPVTASDPAGERTLSALA